MGKTIRGCRKGKNSIFRSHTRLRKGPVKMRKMDFAEKEGYVKGVVKAIIHESGRGAPLAKVQFQNAYRYQRDNELMVAPEGLHEGMFIYCGAKAQLAVGNILPISAIPEGTVICNAEARLGDRGAFARCSGDYAVVVTHDEEKGTSKLRLLSGGKKTVKSKCRAMIGIVAGGGRTDKPMLKAGRAYHKYRPPRGYSSDESRRRRGCDMDSPWRRVAATPRLRFGSSAAVGRARAEASLGRTGSRLCRGRDVDSPRGRVAAAARWKRVPRRPARELARVCTRIPALGISTRHPAAGPRPALDDGTAIRRRWRGDSVDPPSEYPRNTPRPGPGPFSYDGTPPPARSRRPYASAPSSR